MINGDVDEDASGALSGNPVAGHLIMSLSSTRLAAYCARCCLEGTYCVTPPSTDRRNVGLRFRGVLEPRDLTQLMLLNVLELVFCNVSASSVICL